MEDIKTILKEQTGALREDIKGDMARLREDIDNDIKRHIDVLKEDFDSNLKLLAESVSGIQQQLVALREMVVKNTEDIEVIKINIEVIKNSLKKKVDLEEFETLERRVAVLEAKIRQS